MADVTPLKLVDLGAGQGQLREMQAGDKIPGDLLPATEWSADTVSQAEAETGTATIRRAWTSERVRQAVGAANAFSATKLQVARTINGVSFDGTADITVADPTKVPLTSTTGAAVIPAGTGAQRPASPVNGQLRYNSETSQFEGYQGGGWKPIGGGDSSPLFSVMWWPQRSAVPAGYVVADGQTISRATYPDAWVGIQAGNVPTVAEATWQSTAAERGKYTTGDGSSTFRLPDYNGKFSGSLGAVFLRGDGVLSAEIAGVIQIDELRAHSHTFGVGTTDGAAGVADSSRAQTGTISTDSTGGNETRPLNVTGCWVIKLFGAVTEVGSANAAQLASDYANLAGRVSTAESKVAALEAGIKQTPELLWSGNIGSNGVALNLSRPLAAGDMIWLQHSDAAKLNSHPFVLTQELLAGGRALYFIFAGSGVTVLIITNASTLTTKGFTSGYGIEKVYASRAKN